MNNSDYLFMFICCKCLYLVLVILIWCSKHLLCQAIYKFCLFILGSLLTAHVCHQLWWALNSCGLCRQCRLFPYEFCLFILGSALTAHVCRQLWWAFNSCMLCRQCRLYLCFLCVYFRVCTDGTRLSLVVMGF